MYTGFPGGSNSKKSACNAGDPSSIPGSGRSLDKRMATHSIYIYTWLHWVFVAVHRLSLVAASGGYSVAVHWLLIAVVSLVVEHGL